jgi:hypothetical protein
MLKTGDDLPKLFRSLGSNGEDTRPTNSIASRDAEQRWPLLRAMPPKEPPEAPLLTDQEKLSWQTPPSARTVQPVPPPAMPSLSDKLGMSLKKMSAQAKTEQAPKKSRAKAATALPVPAPAPTPEALVPAPAPKPVASIQEASKPAKPKIRVAPVENKIEVATVSTESATHRPSADTSLKGVFSRLEPIKKESPPSVLEKRPSYLGRLGKK